MINDRHWWLFFILLFAVVTTTWLTFNTTKPATIVNANQDTLDAFATGVHITNLDKTGHISTQIYTPSLTHHTLRNRIQLQSPVVTLYVKNQPPWSITADTGELQQGTEVVYLNDHVILHQPKGTNNEEVTVQTPKLTVYPEKKLALTELPITLSSASANISSVGMQADLGQGTLHLNASTRGKYEIPAG